MGKHHKRPTVYGGGPTWESYRALKAISDLGTGLHSVELIAQQSGLSQETAAQVLRTMRANLLLRMQRRKHVIFYSLNVLGRTRLKTCLESIRLQKLEP